jgi:hypothetical protein
MPPQTRVIHAHPWAHLKAPLKILLYVSLSAVSLLLIAVIGSFAWLRWEQHLPSEQLARQQFVGHRTDYIHFASLLRQDTAARFISSDGSVDVYTNHARVVPEYRDLMRRIGAKDVIVREDGSMEFALWGFGCAICSDSYMGIRYFPVQSRPAGRPGWVQILVSSLDGKALPQENGSIADGLYVVQLEPEWFIYRFEYRE